jgi:hypothetical protein
MQNIELADPSMDIDDGRSLVSAYDAFCLDMKKTARGSTTGESAVMTKVKTYLNTANSKFRAGDGNKDIKRRQETHNRR